jgi:hypothetical protein
MLGSNDKTPRAANAHRSTAFALGGIKTSCGNLADAIYLGVGTARNKQL